MHAILALAVGAAAFGSSSSATSSEDLESIEATLDHVEEMSLGVLGLGSGDLNLFERAGFVVPFDWECQTGTSGGVYPCPNGIPSTCRAREHGRASPVCAKCYCEVGSHTCCTYYSESNTYSEDGYWYGGFECPSALLSGGELVTDSAVNYCEVGDAVSALYDDGESYSATVTEVTGSDITVTYSDDDTSTYDLTESGNVWGNQWWNDPYVSQSYINFKVFSTGDVHFKPDNAERTVYINEQVEYEYETDARYRHSNTRGGSQKPAAASEVPSPKGEPAKDAPVEKARRRLGRRGGGFIATTGSFSISSGNRSGNG
ncbi:hypothetical protein SO694_00119083 [Aureococcus anophagefferens]|uniref:Tudor domain-containing protein n=1 Tax=Aureococcus anophagefferens TaxID=44056 RepID=A0ABR1FW77_AURAN